MLRDAGTHATLPANDLARARAFYEGTLGLTVVEEAPGGLFFEQGDGSRFFVYPTQGAASGAHTQMGFRVDDIESEVAALQSRGVQFIEYDFPGLKTVDGIADTGPVRAAWFNDTEGNLLGIVQLA